MRQFWLLKSEPSVFSIDNLKQAPKGTTCWEGVRNYQARNYLKAMVRGDQAFFYHSNADPPAIVGIVEVVREAYPDPYALDARSQYFDPRSSPDNPRWVVVDVRFIRKFSHPLALQSLRGCQGLEKLELLRKGSRLSVQPVREQEWKLLLLLATQKLTRGG